MNIQWFPGHMAKAERMISDNMRLVDAVCEILDARIPGASRNPDIERLCGAKPRLVVLNRVDLAEPSVTAGWSAYYKAAGNAVLETDAKSGRGMGGFPAAVRTLLRDKLLEYAAKGQAGRAIRLMVLGIPNVGKSTFINKAAARRAARVSDRPGVTRGKQWITLDKGIELLDTPGILWPRFDDKETGEYLAFTGAVRDEVVDRETLAARLMARLRDIRPECIEGRYKLRADDDATGYELLERAAKNRGFLAAGGGYDMERMAVILLDEFRAGMLGRISLERPPKENGFVGA